jgi:glycosyltransferase involved in cell wall biosynthesis
MSEARVGIHVVAYNAAGTLAWVLDRIPESFRPSIAAVLVSDDHAMDRTYEVGDEYRRLETGLPITVVRQPRNLGYGGNQKFGYRWMIEQGIDIVAAPRRRPVRPGVPAPDRGAARARRV